MYQIIIFTRNDLKLILIGTVAGGFVQYFCWRYVKAHPEVFKELSPQDSEKLKSVKELPSYPGPGIIPYGGAFIEITAVKIVITGLAKWGFIIGTGIGASIVGVKKIPSKALSKITRRIRNKLMDGSPISHTEWGKLYNIELDPLADCGYDLKYLVGLLTNKDIPYDERNRKVLAILKQQLDFQNTGDLVLFVACLASILTLFTLLNDYTSIFLIMENLLEAFRKGKISKKALRYLIRKLLRKNIPVDPELMRAADY